jgi:hypothetical protein
MTLTGVRALFVLLAVMALTPHAATVRSHISADSHRCDSLRIGSREGQKCWQQPQSAVAVPMLSALAANRA